MTYNFSAGPAVLYDEVLEELQKNIVDYKGHGYSLIEESHRSKVYDEVHMQTMSLLAELLNINQDDYKIMFLGGGATLQFAMLAYNFLHSGKTAHYILTGAWGKKSYADAKKIGDAQILYDGASNNYTSLPSEFPQPDTKNHAYTHFVTNETIGGIQFQECPQVQGHLVADMSSDMLSRPIDTKKYSFIYAGAQKNVGPAGLTLAIVRKDFLEEAQTGLPSYLAYKTHADKDSLFNTPPVFSIWATSLVLAHIKKLGGLQAVEKINTEKANLLYSCINSSEGFYSNPVEKQYQSKMNVVFRLPSEELEAQFVSEASAERLLCLKGHRSIGGCRASIYNAMPIEGVKVLVDFMKNFQEKNA